MKFEKSKVYRDEYEFTSINQHGTRYKKIGTKDISVCKMSISTDNNQALLDLVALGHMLDCPVRVDFERKKAYIEVAGKEAI